MSIALGTQKFEGKKREKVAGSRDRFASRQSGFLNNLTNIELFDKRRKQENTGGITIDASVVKLADMNPLGHSWHLGAFNGQSELELIAPGKSFKPFFSQNALNRANGNFDAVFGKQLNNFAGGKFVFTVVTNFGPRQSIYLSAFDLPFRNRFGKVDFFMGELVPQQVDIALGITETLGNSFSR